MSKLKPVISRDTVFIVGGQPSITYVERAHLDLEGRVRKAIKAPNQIASLAGPSKSGKTVLCRKVLANSPFVWLEGGQIGTSDEIWDKVCYELNLPDEISKEQGQESKGEVAAGLKFVFSAAGSHLRKSGTQRTYKIDSMASAIRHLREESIALVIDDFHYIPADARKSFLRNIKGPVFNGLKVVLLSVTHRGDDAVKAEKELIGRVTSVVVPEWNVSDLKQIGKAGFHALNIVVPENILTRLSTESQSSPFLMQQLCLEVCIGIGVDERAIEPVKVSGQYELAAICRRIANDSGHPIYHKLEVGPQSRKARQKRPLVSGGNADIYKAILMAIAATGPASRISYDELRHQLNEILKNNVPQKHEITSALKHLAKISQQIGNDAGLDWDEDGRKVDISDPYLRFYLRWQVRPIAAIRHGNQLEMILGRLLIRR